MEPLSSCIEVIVDNVFNKLFNAVDRKLGYLFKYHKNIEKLKKELKKLEDARDNVGKKIQAARVKGETIQADVQSWIKDVDDIISNTKTFVGEVGDITRNTKCFGGWCINCRSRYRFGKKAHQKSGDISVLLKQEEKFERVAHPAPPSEGIISSTPEEIFESFESRKSIMKQILEALKDENVSKIGIIGMVGVGKTTLAKEIAKQAEQQKSFDAVAMADVSEDPNFLTIQEEILNTVTRGQLPVNNYGDSLKARARTLFDRIKKERRILIILDDVWEPIDLDTIGIPFGKNHRGCKIVLTSRNKEVCSQMGAKPFEICTLSKQESWDLFKEIVGQEVDDPDINPIARNVADKCGGLPIAILTIGKAMKDKSSYVWSDAEKQLNKSIPTYVKETYKNMVPSLERSYNYLQSKEAKSLFLFCCLFPKNYNIKIEQLLRYGFGLKWFEDTDTVEEARNRAHAIVSNLISSFLLIVGDENGCVKMHDVVRDVALTIAFKHNNTFLVKAGMGLIDWPTRGTLEDVTTISLISTRIRGGAPDSLNCPYLQALLLEGSEFTISSTFFKETKDLKVLDLSGWSIPELSTALLDLAKLRTLCLERCSVGHIMENLSIIGNLTNLEILSLFGGNFVEIPGSFSQLSRLRLLNLKFVEGLRTIPRDVISRLENLEELDMWNDFHHWDCENNSSTSEFKHLSRLTNLRAIFRQPVSFQNNSSPFQNLNHFTIRVGFRIPGGRFNFRDLDACYGKEKYYSRRMGLSHDMHSEGSRLEDWVKDLLKKSDALLLEDVRGLEKVQDDRLLDGNGFTTLKFLNLSSCHDAKYLLNTSEWSQENVTFNNLEVLKIEFCDNFVELCHGEVLPSQTFRKLKHLSVGRCSGLTKLFPLPVLQSLDCLEEIHIFECSRLDEVVIIEKKEGILEQKMERIVFPKLHSVELNSLNRLTCFCSAEDVIFEFPALEKPKIHNCPKMKTFCYGKTVTPKLSEQEWEEIKKQSMQAAGGSTN